ncbi:MAG: hypothetical protein ACI89X_001806, partial [Planctomycetota bacterium]
MRLIHSLLFVAVLPFTSCGIARQELNDPLDAALIKQLVPGQTT